jgi:hypothetical protein
MKRRILENGKQQREVQDLRGSHFGFLHGLRFEAGGAAKSG